MSTPGTHDEGDTIRLAVIEALRTVHDPELPVNVYDLGLIYDLDIARDGMVSIKMTLTTPNCPVADMLVRQVGASAEQVQGVERAQVSLVWEPAWSGEMMSEDARLQLEMMGISWREPHARGPAVSKLTIGHTTRRHT